jgi:hypothetical protein
MTVIFSNRHFERQRFLDDRRLMLPGFDAVTNDGGLAQRLGGLKPMQALDQYEARPVRAYQDRCLLAIRKHAVRDRIDALQVERFAPCGRHVDMSDREGLAFQHVGEGSTVARAVRLIDPQRPSGKDLRSTLCRIDSIGGGRSRLLD